MVDETNSNELISPRAILEENPATNVVESLGEVNNLDSLDSNIEESPVTPDEATVESVNGLEETDVP